MDRARRYVVTAGGAAVAAFLLLRQRGVVASGGEGGEGGAVTVVRGSDRPAVVADGAAIASAPEIAAWQAEVGQPIALAAGAQQFRGSVVSVTPAPRGTAVAPAASSRLWGMFAGTAQMVAPTAAAAAAMTAARLPSGVRPYAFRVLIAIEEGPALTSDTMMALGRPVEGLRELFVQPATAVNGKSMVAAWFG